MSIRYNLNAKAIEEQIHFLRLYPELAEKHYRPAVQRNITALHQIIFGQIPVQTGLARKTFGSRVIGKGFRIRGQVGWYDAGDPWYINVVEHGAKPHVIKSKKEGGFLWFGGTYARQVQHPGFSARGFMMAASSTMQPAIEKDIAEANERIISDMMVKS